MNPQDPTDTTCSTREAAALLGVVERSIVLYLSRGELTGFRRGRSWRVSLASLHRHPHFGSAPEAPALPPRKTTPTPEPAAPTPPPPLAEPLPPKRARREWTYRNLRVLVELTDLASQVARALDDLPPPARPFVGPALDSAAEAVRHGAAGFHAFVARDKIRLYARAREHVAMTAASLWIVADLTADRADGLRRLARTYEQAAPGLGALMRSAGSSDA